jgi:hypothetical protein
MPLNLCQSPLIGTVRSTGFAHGRGEPVEAVDVLLARSAEDYLTTGETLED